MQSKRVLLVEDDPGILQGLETVLQEEGYEVTTVLSAESALAILHMGAHPDLILLNLVMPGVGGFGFLQEWKATPSFRSIPVVVMSAYCDPHGVSRILGLAGSVKKPFRVETLLTTLASAGCA